MTRTKVADGRRKPSRNPEGADSPSARSPLPHGRGSAGRLPLLLVVFVEFCRFRCLIEQVAHHVADGDPVFFLRPAAVVVLELAPLLLLLRLAQRERHPPLFGAN